MAADHQHTLCRYHRFGTALALCLFLIWTTQSDSQGTRPSKHGLIYEKNPGDQVSPEMIAFFGQPKTGAQLPEARNVSDPAWRSAARVIPVQDINGGRKRSSGLFIAGVVFVVLGISLLATAVLAYMLHARQSRQRSSSTSLVGLSSARWRGGPEVLGTP